MKRLLTSLSCLLLSLFTVSACTPQDTFHAGRPITKEELASISAELFSTAPEPSDAEVEQDPPSEETESAPPEFHETTDDSSHGTSPTDTTAPKEETTSSPTPNLNQTVYWIKNGTVYHTDPHCHHLDGYRTLKEATRRTAEINGLRPCKDCTDE